MNQSNIESKDGGLYEKSSGRKIVSPLDSPLWCCQRCGEEIGYIGRFIECICAPLLWTCKSIFHTCPSLFVCFPKKEPKGKSDYRGNNFPIIRSGNRTSTEKSDYT